MYPTKEHIKYIGTVVRDSAHLEEIDKPRSARWYLAKAYEIHQHRQDAISEQVCIRAFEQYTLEPMRDKISAPIREWIQSEIDPKLDRAIYATPGPWIGTPEHVYAHQPRWQSIAVCAKSLPLGDDHEPNSEANAKLAAHSPDLIGQLDDAQLVLMQQMHQISTNQQPRSSELTRAATDIDYLLLNLQTDIKDSTGGPWEYDPKTFVVSGRAPKNKSIPVLRLANPNEYHNCDQLRAIHANGRIIAHAPQVINQLAETSLALTEATYRLQAHQPLAAFDKLHTAALVNHQLLSAVRGNRINPLALDPAPGTPALDTWIDSNLSIIAAAQKITRNSQPGPTTYSTAQQQSGIYAGTIRAETTDSYLQLRNDDKLIAHWKGSFLEPLEIGKTYNINYNQARATAKEIPAKDVATSARNR